MQNFATQFAIIGASLGFTAAEIAQVQDDNACFQDLASGQVEVDAFADAVRDYRKTVTEGAVGDPTPAYPADPSTTPSELPPTGIFQRLIELVARIRVAPGFTPETAALLGIGTTPDEPLAESEMKPQLNAAARLGNLVNVSFVRGKTQGVEIETMIDNETAWTTRGRYGVSPAVISVEDANGIPRKVQIRGHYIVNDAPAGSNSDIVTISTTP